MKVLVTGGAGFIGSHLVGSLVAHGHEVTVIDNLSHGTYANLSHLEDRIVFIQGDVVNSNVLNYPPLIPTNRDYQNPEVIYILHCHPRSFSFRNPQRDIEVNVIGTINMLELAREKDAKVIFASNSGIYDTSRLPINEQTKDSPKTPYDLNKLQAEKYIKLYHETYGVPYTIFRFASVYGPRQRVGLKWRPVIPEFIQKLSKREAPTIYWDGEQTRDFIYVKDVVSALILAMNRGNNETIILGTGKETSINQLYFTIKKLLGLKIPLLPIRRPKQLGDIRRMRYDCLKAKRVLGWQPRYTLEQGLKETIKHYKLE